MSLINEFHISADNMHVTNDLLQEAIALTYSPSVPKPNVVALSAATVTETDVYNLVDTFRDRSAITVTLIDKNAEVIESLPFPQGPVQPQRVFVF